MVRRWVIDLPAIMMPMAPLALMPFGKTYSPAISGLLLESKRTPSRKMRVSPITFSVLRMPAISATPLPFGITSVLSSVDGPGPVKLA